METEKLKTDYQDNIGRAERLRDSIVVQLRELLISNNITLGVPIESRLKSWSSIQEKLHVDGRDKVCQKWSFKNGPPG